MITRLNTTSESVMQWRLGPINVQLDRIGYLDNFFPITTSYIATTDLQRKKTRGHTANVVLVIRS